MGIRQHAHQIIGVQHQGTQLRTGGTTLHHRQIQLEVFQHIIKIIYIVRNNRYGDTGVFIGVTGQHLCHNAALRRVGDADAQPGEPPSRLLQFLRHLLLQRLHPAHIPQHGLPLGSQHQIAVSPHKQPHPQLLFQLADVVAHRRLGQRKRLGCPGEIPLLRHQQQRVQLGIKHGTVPPSP